MSDLSIFHGPNAAYVQELYERFQQDPASVGAEWRAFFASWTPDGVAAAPAGAPSQPAAGPPAPVRPADGSVASLRPVAGLVELVRGIREYGHLAARIDPLGGEAPGDPELDPERHGVRASDLAELPAELVDSPVAAGARHALDAVVALRRIYSGTTGYDYDHVQVAEERQWLKEAAETGRFRAPLAAEAQRELLERLTQVETFEQYLHQRFVGQKRFSIEGTDMLVPVLDEIIRLAALSGTRDIVLGMAHRGRLNVLAHVLGKPYEAVLAEFHHPEEQQAVPWEGTDTGWLGDVKYHLGARTAYQAGAVVRVPITMAPNPSHLEFVNPVVEGMARAGQERRDAPGGPYQDETGSLAILMHGDAAFPGEGVVAETLNLSRLAGYRTGGTIHIIVNNQIGFTTEPRESRSTLYASDLAKGFEIPIVHVNADDPEACLAAARLAHAYRQRFRKDFLIDLVGYRRWGHNEGDEPAFTQPRLYERIANHPTVRARWAGELERRGTITADEAQAMIDRYRAQLEAAQKQAGQATNGAGSEPLPLAVGEARTAVPAETLRAYNRALLALPTGFHVHPRLERLLQRRATALDEEGTIDWAHAETLAFAAILADGVPIRLTGQDTERGTFSHRHAVLHDVETGTRYVPLQTLPAARAAFAVFNSPLSEVAVLGFEYGYSIHAPETLVLWEAQFGDFANVAQVIIDQFIVSARAKWLQTPSLVLLLPHGYEGQGPEHSSARLERFIQLAADDNLRLVNCTTAAQYFHVLRRQAALLRRDPRPLVVMTPKSLLRHPLAASRLEELTEGTFQCILDDPVAQARPHAVTRLVLCSGKIAIDLVNSQARAAAEHVAVARVEELYPFPVEEMTALFERYPSLQEIVWVQEEPRNMGAWRYMAPRLRALAPPEVPVSYIGRARRASPAEGSADAHAAEQARIVQAAFGGLPEAAMIEEHGVKHAG